MEALGIHRSWLVLQEKVNHKIRERIPRTFFDDVTTGEFSRKQMTSSEQDHIHRGFARRHRIFIKSYYLLTQNVYQPQNSASILRKTQMLFPTTVSYWFTATGSLLGCGMPGRQKKKLSKLKEFYLPGPDGYGCVPVIIYSSSCPKKQQNFILITVFSTTSQNNAFKQEIEENRAKETCNHLIISSELHRSLILIFIDLFWLSVF